MAKQTLVDQCERTLPLSDVAQQSVQQVTLLLSLHVRTTTEQRGLIEGDRYSVTHTKESETTANTQPFFSPIFLCSVPFDTFLANKILDDEKVLDEAFLESSPRTRQEKRLELLEEEEQEDQQQQPFFQPIDGNLIERSLILRT